jgi:hypothetical protein
MILIPKTQAKPAAFDVMLSCCSEIKHVSSSINPKLTPTVGTCFILSQVTFTNATRPRKIIHCPSLSLSLSTLSLTTLLPFKLITWNINNYY